MLFSPKVGIQWAGSVMAIVGAFAQVPGSFKQVGDTKVSAMMMFLGNEQKVYILDKVEGNPSQINGHPAWGAEWDIASSTATLMDVPTNSFCAAGMHFPNGSWATFGGNAAVGPGGNIGSVPNSGGVDALYDATYQDWDGRRAIRILNPCPSTAQCQWFDNTTYVGMQKPRWYASTEALADGSIVIVGGYVNGGYINRNTPNVDPAYSEGAAEPTFEFWPSRGIPAAVMQFMITTSGLNSYAHLYLMPSGKMFAQANFSTILWDYNNNIETPLPDMPGRVIRVYPASGAVAMLPLTPGNNYTPTILFCGGSDMPEPAWGNYSWPAIDTWNYPASRDCQRITPEPMDGSQPVYIQDDEMLEGRTMGQFIILPDSTLLVLNGALNGTAGYATQTGETPTYGQMPFGMSLASGPVLTPAIYDPNAPPGQRWNRFGESSAIPRLYHSTALLLPDGSVLVAGSNPNVDVNFTTTFPTTYAAERFYPPYFANIANRPVPEGLPDTLSYGGAAFQVYLPVGAYVGDPNEAAGSARVVLVRPGFSTHAMNMGQRLLQLDSSFEVSDEGNIVLHIAQVPPNPNLLTPGPVLMFVVVGGVPSVGKMVTVGTGNFGTQPVQDPSFLPPSRARPSPAPSTAAVSADPNHASNGSRTKIVAIAVSAGGGVLIATLLLVIYLIRKRKRDASENQYLGGPTTLPPQPPSMASLWRPEHDSTSEAWTPSVNGSHPQLAPRVHPYESESNPSLGGPIVSPARVYSGSGPGPIQR
ncbi:unnamed protein product [Rhizoctonia solani]|uniref:Galactose oxidase n=1 Tax=Rhizoctonia solani TaxID=456999 RepID=A0A8H3A5C3_9AGAM|nr:unnamed protein product [Rhizoctonia solani]